MISIKVFLSSCVFNDFYFNSQSFIGQFAYTTSQGDFLYSTDFFFIMCNLGISRRPFNASPLFLDKAMQHFMAFQIMPCSFPTTCPSGLEAACLQLFPAGLSAAWEREVALHFPWTQAKLTDVIEACNNSLQKEQCSASAMLASGKELVAKL